MGQWPGPLEPGEERLLACVERGEQYDAGPPGRQPMEDWGPERTVRAAMLRHLLTDPQWPVHARGLVLRRVRISGPLDLESAVVRCPVRLKECYFDSGEPVLLELATVSELALLGCRLAGLIAGSLVATRRLELSRSTFTGPVELGDAAISGGLLCLGTALRGPGDDGYALTASRLTVTGGVFLTDFRWRDDPPRPFTAAGGIALSDATISGGLTLENARIEGADGEGFALSGYRLKVTGALSLSRAQVRSGGICLIDADLTGPLTGTGTRIEGYDQGRRSLVADGIKAGSGAYLSLGQAGGAVSLLDAAVTGQLSFRGADIAGTTADGVSVAVDRCTATGGLWLDGGFHAAGAVRLSGVSVTGMLSCAGARLDGADERGDSLIADGALVSGDAYLNQGFRSAGAVNLRSARIGGSLTLRPAALPAGLSATALDASAATIGTELDWQPEEAVTGRVVLRDVRAGSLRDAWTGERGTVRPNGHWPSAGQGQLVLDGFGYDRLSGPPPPSPADRLAWIGSYPRRSAARVTAGFGPQPYEQLVAVYQRAGQDTEARAAAIARRRDLRWYGDIGRRRRAVSWLLDVTIRYGYETWRALALLAGLYLFVLAVFLVGQHQSGAVVPAQNVTGLRPVPTALRCTEDYPCFYPAGYAIDTVVPVIDIGQGGNWRPSASARFGWFYVFVSWAGIGGGWALSTLVVAGYTGLARRVDSP